LSALSPAHRLGGGDVHVANRDTRPGAREMQSNRATDPAPAPGDSGGYIGEKPAA
jgi:hypothetical protein